MKTFKTIQLLQDYLKEKNLWHKTGFIPTMGNLHHGHLSLIKESMKNHHIHIISIFVNPTQFIEGEDFDQYPRTLELDIKKIKTLEKEGHQYILFAPNEKDIYANDFSTKIIVMGLTNQLCGQSRPGHFDGVTTVLTLLFNIIRPKSVYMGKKDYQQVLVTKKLVKDLRLDIEIIPCPIIRQDDHMALSSRNSYLKDEKISNKLFLYQSLLEIKEAILNGSSFTSIKKEIEEKTPKDIRWDYLEIRDLALNPFENQNQGIILGALYLNGVRLIDNIEFELWKN